MNQSTAGATRATLRSARDAAIFLLAAPLVFAVTGIGAMSGDAIAQAGIVGTGHWQPNPNHLLLELTGALWLTTMRSIGVRAPAPDVLAWLSVCAGAVALALFRWLVAPELVSRRRAANVSTVCLALFSAFDRLWISGEAHMIQMPFLVIFLAGMLRLPSSENDASHRLGQGLAIAGATGAVLAFISNALIVAAVAIAVAAATASRRRALTSLLFGGLASGFVLTAVWAVDRPGVGLVTWLTSYAGGSVSAQAAAGYGVGASLSSLIVSTTRSLYGLMSSIVDLAPLTDRLRRGIGSGPAAALHVAGCAAAVLVLGIAARRCATSRAQVKRLVLASVCAAVLAIVFFGVLWNNSDDQFYFQTAPFLTALGLAGLEGVTGPAIAALIALPVLLNLQDFTVNYLRYPREKRIRALTEAVSRAELVVAPGRDEVGQLLYYAVLPTRSHLIFVSTVAEHVPATEGLKVLRDTVAATLAHGGTVALINIDSASTRMQPWPRLAQMGYDAPGVLRQLRLGRVRTRVVVTPTIAVDLLTRE